MGSTGTQMLPESQLDRFMICMTMGYPDIRYEIEIVKGNQKRQSERLVHSVISASMIQQMQEYVEEIYVHDRVYQYIGSLIQMTREHPMIAYGVSPRGTDRSCEDGESDRIFTWARILYSERCARCVFGGDGA